MTFLWFMATSSPCQAENLTGQLQYAEGTYRISVGDLLSVNVYNQPDLSHNGILVRPDGNASFNGIGEIQVVGKTIREASSLLESQLRELVREPRITLTVSESKPPTLYLAGAVIRPGMLQLGNSPQAISISSDRSDIGGNNGLSGAASAGRMDFHLSSVLASAGGVKLNADLANVMITRDGQPYKTVNLWNMLKNGDNTGDVMLQNGDSVYIPELPEQALDDDTYRLLLASSIGPRMFPVRIIGEVKAPGIYELTAQSPYLNTALVKGGGFGTDANRKVVALRRFTAQDKFTTVFIDPNRHDFMLRPNDVIYVSQLKSYKTGHFAENVSKMLLPFSSAASTAFGFALLGGLR
jgi:protein involved in polysaccharide export with SLBB domain